MISDGTAKDISLCKKAISISLMRMAKVHDTMETSIVLFRQQTGKAQRDRNNPVEWNILRFLPSTNANFHENAAMSSAVVIVSR